MRSGYRRFVVDRLSVRTVHRPLFEQPDDFLDYLTDVVVPSTAQLPRS